MATIVGVFSQRETAEQAVRALRDEGFDREISIAAKGDEQGGEGGEEQHEGFGIGASGEGGMATENISEGTTWGGALGGIAGLLAGAGALAIPGIGPIVAAGPLAAALSGAVAGGVAGGLLDLGIPEEEGRRFEEDVKQGKVLAVIEADGDRAGRAESVLNEHGADEVNVY